MKKVVGKSLALGAIALGLISLLGGSNVFSLLKNIKFPSKSKKQESPVNEAEKAEFKEEEKTEEARESKVTDIALEEAAKEIPAEKPVQAEEPRIEDQVKAEPVPQPQPQRQAQEPKLETEKPKVAKPKPASSKPNGTLTRKPKAIKAPVIKEWFKYDEKGKPIWSSTKGRLVDTEEEIEWKRKYVSINEQGSSGSEGKGVWCLTPSGNYNVSKTNECFNDPRWGVY